MGQFERTLIIADEGSSVHYIEGCTAPIYSSDSLHSAVVELIAKKGAHIRYTTIQNWSNNVYNLVTKRAVAYEHATSSGSTATSARKVTMKYPGVYLMGRGRQGPRSSRSPSPATGQHQDAGGKIIHAAPNTTSTIISKSISKGGGRTSYRGLLKIHKGAENVKSSVRCDALMLDEISRSDTYPSIEIDEEQVTHRARGVGQQDRRRAALLPDEPRADEDEAKTMIVNGFFEASPRSCRWSTRVELNRLLAALRWKARSANQSNPQSRAYERPASAG